MQATQTSLMNILTSPDRLVVPLYHRSYRWSSRQWSDYWEDTLRGGRRESGRYFMGVVYTCEGDEQQFEVVDGMHRLVTAVLLMAALRDAFPLDTEGLPLPLSDVPQGKFLLKGADDGTLRRIIEGQTQTAECSRRMFDAYLYFLDRAKNLAEAGQQEICRGLNGLRVLWVALEKADDPQDIYLAENS